MQQRRRRAVFAALLAALVGLIALAAPADGTPRPQPTPAAQPAAKPSATPAPAKSPVLGISLSLGVLQVGLNVPLTLDGLLKPIAPATTAPATPPPPPTTVHRTAPSSASHHAVQSAPPPPYPPTSPTKHLTRPAKTHPSHPASQHQSSGPASTTATRRPHGATSSSHKPDDGIVFVHGVVPTNGVAIFVLLCIACAVGVAVVVKLSGGRRRL
ncbi:MAG TPA: hypothetical protein VHC23_00170 [Jatrophihabitans sp.]|nr:hypothetical protein [Jatrophihabitans sp.]